MSSDKTAYAATLTTLAADPVFVKPSSAKQAMIETEPPSALMRLAIPSVSWQTQQKLDKHFKPWPGLMGAMNTVAKMGVIAALPLEARESAGQIVDDLTHHVFHAPYRMHNALQGMRAELPLITKVKRNRHKKTESHSCEACYADTIKPKPFQRLGL